MTVQGVNGSRPAPGSSPCTPPDKNIINLSPRQHGEVVTMKNAKIKLYTFEELNQDAKNAVIERERNTEYGFSYLGIENAGDEIADTIKEFPAAFDISYEIKDSYGRPFVSFHVDIEDEDATGKYLLRFLNNHYFAALSRRYYYKGGKSRKSRIMYDAGQCPLTGICWDCDILQPIFDWFKSPDWNLSVRDLMENCFCSVLKTYEAEREYCFSDEYIEDMILNNWEDKLYFEDGTEYDGPAFDEFEEAA